MFPLFDLSEEIVDLVVNAFDIPSHARFCLTSKTNRNKYITRLVDKVIEKQPFGEQTDLVLARGPMRAGALLANPRGCELCENPAVHQIKWPFPYRICHGCLDDSLICERRLGPDLSKRLANTLTHLKHYKRNFHHAFLSADVLSYFEGEQSKTMIEIFEAHIRRGEANIDLRREYVVEQQEYREEKKEWNATAVAIMRELGLDIRSAKKTDAFWRFTNTYTVRSSVEEFRRAIIPETNVIVNHQIMEAILQEASEANNVRYSDLYRREDIRNHAHQDRETVIRETHARVITRLAIKRAIEEDKKRMHKARHRR